MAGVIKNHRELSKGKENATERETYATRHLPVDLAEQVLAKADEFAEFLNGLKVTTHPGVRGITNAIEVGTTLIKAELAADGLIGTEDDTDAWQRAGIVPKPRE